jgi:hypothetical protein
MKQEIKKLSLKRETLMPMNDEELVNVNGGTLSAATRAVSRASVAFSKWSSRGCLGSAAIEASIEASKRVFGGGDK